MTSAQRSIGGMLCVSQHKDQSHLGDRTGNAVAEDAAAEIQRVPLLRVFRDGLPAPRRQQMEELLALCRGNDCHVSEQGFTVTILGGDRTGSTFWLAAQKDAPQFLRDWYLENERTLRSSWGQRFQYLP